MARKPLVKDVNEARAVFPDLGSYREYLSFKRSCEANGLRFQKGVLLIWYCKTSLGWSREKVRDKTGVSVRKIREVIRNMKMID